MLDMSHNGLDGAIVLDTGLGVLLQSCIRLESKQLEPMITESCMSPLEGAIPDCPHVVADGYGIASVVPGLGSMPSVCKHSLVVCRSHRPQKGDRACLWNLVPGLDMSRNPLGQAAMLEIAQSALYRCRRLTRVNLGDCQAGDEGVVGIAQALTSSTRLTHLMLPRSRTSRCLHTPRFLSLKQNILW